MLYRSNKVMYDRLTNTLWSQLLGKPIVGELVGSGITLEFFPVALTTWGEWLAEHPNTKVMSRETGYYAPHVYEREDDERSIYFAYRQDVETMFPVWERDARLPTKQEVLGLTADGVHKAYSIEALRERRVVNDSVNGLDLVMIASPISMDALAFRRGEHEFALPLDAPNRLPDVVVDAEGVEWEVRRDMLVNSEDASQTLAAIPVNVYFWFGWYAAHPDTLLFGEP